MRFFIILLLVCATQSKAQDILFEQVIKIINIDSFAQVVVKSNIQLIDVRTRKEYDRGHIKQARNIPIKNKRKFKENLQELDKERPIYVYCYSGVRSKRASRILKQLGFKDIIDFREGWKAWSKQ